MEFYFKIQLNATEKKMASYMTLLNFRYINLCVKAEAASLIPVNVNIFGEDKDIGIIVYTYKMYYEDFKDVSLWNADKAEMDEYIETLMYEFSDDNPEYLGTVMAGKIPFVLIKGTDEDGEYLYAETMTNGHAIIFDCYMFDEDGENQFPFTQEYVDQIKSILATFLPVS